MSLAGWDLPEGLRAFATALAVGLLIGLERERKADAKAGLRTFALVTVLGALSALIARETGSGWILAAGLAVVGAMMIVTHAVDPQDDGDPGTTTMAALMVAYCLGAAIWFGHGTLAVMLGIATTVLLYFKAQLQGISKSLTHRDLISIFQFSVLSFIVLPILPNRDFGPYGTFNPHQIWWMVVLISGVSLAGYAALRFVGARYGATVVGFLGGLVSSTATTLVFARNARSDADLTRTATVVILLANLMVMIRLSVVSAVVAPSLLVPIAVVLGTGFAGGLLVAAWDWRGMGHSGHLPMPEVTNPTELRTALTFGALYAVVLLLAAWLQDEAGRKGLYLVSLASGLTDVDAITLSTLRLFGMEKLSDGEAVTSIALAVLANLAFKSGLVVGVGGGALARRTLPGMVAMGIGMGIGIPLAGIA